MLQKLIFLGLTSISAGAPGLRRISKGLLFTGVLPADSLVTSSTATTTDLTRYAAAAESVMNVGWEAAVEAGNESVTIPERNPAVTDLEDSNEIHRSDTENGAVTEMLEPQATADRRLIFKDDFVFYANRDFLGGDRFNVAIDNFMTCRNICRDNIFCLTFVWTDTSVFGQGRCHIKGAVKPGEDGLSVLPGAITGYALDAPAPYVPVCEADGFRRYQQLSVNIPDFDDRAVSCGGIGEGNGTYTYYTFRSAIGNAACVLFNDVFDERNLVYDESSTTVVECSA